MAHTVNRACSIA